ncbi:MULTISPECIES: site-specific integrase [unclassified Geodermatophilus]
MAYSGLRIGEATALTQADVDRERGQVRVSRTSVEVGGVLLLQPAKTRAGNRTVPVPPKVLAMLNTSASVIFTGKAGGPLRVNAFRRRYWLPAAQASGLKVRIHDLRHTAISYWIGHGANLLELKTRAGHTSSNFTIDRYGHLMHTGNSTLMAALDADIV